MTDENANELLDKLAQSLGYVSFVIYDKVYNAFCVAFFDNMMQYDPLCDSSDREFKITGSLADFARQLYKMFKDGHELHVGRLCISRDDGRAMQFMLEYELLSAV